MGKSHLTGSSYQFREDVALGKLAQDKVDGIIAMYKSGERIKDIAEALGVAMKTVSHYTNGVSRCAAPPSDLDGEEWREVRGYDGRYLVSNLGRVFMTGKAGGRCGLMSQQINDGYCLVHLCSSGGPSTKRVHRLVAEAFVPGRSFERNQVNHVNGNRSDNRSENLEWVTQSENIQHAYHVLGNVNKGRKLTSRQVKNIRRSEHGAKYLARRYKVGRTTIREIKQGIRYRDVV